MVARLLHGFLCEGRRYALGILLLSEVESQGSGPDAVSRLYTCKSIDVVVEVAISFPDPKDKLPCVCRLCRACKGVDDADTILRQVKAPFTGTPRSDWIR